MFQYVNCASSDIFAMTVEPFWKTLQINSINAIITRNVCSGAKKCEVDHNRSTGTPQLGSDSNPGVQDFRVNWR